MISVLDHGADRTGVSDSSVAFQAAVDAAASLGDDVEVPPGTYALNSTRVETLTGTFGTVKSAVVVPGDMALVGRPGRSHIKGNTLTGNLFLGYNVNNAARISFEGLRFFDDANTGNYDPTLPWGRALYLAANDVDITRCTFSNIGLPVATSGTYRRWRIRECEFSQFVRSAVFAPSELRFSDNRVTGLGSLQTNKSAHGVYGGDHCEVAAIDGNTFTDVSGSCVHWYSGSGTQMGRVSVQGNMMSGHYAGVQFVGVPPSNILIVSGNTFHPGAVSESSDVVIDRCDHATVRDNTHYRDPQGTLNEYDGANTKAILVRCMSGGGISQHIAVENNSISGYWNAMHLTNKQTGMLRDFSIRDNTISNTRRGLLIEADPTQWPGNLYDGRITGNVFRDGPKYEFFRRIYDHASVELTGQEQWLVDRDVVISDNVVGGYSQ